MAVVTIRELLEAGAHLGHRTNRWNPKMKRFIFEERNGIYIIDLKKTLRQLEKAWQFLRDLSAEGKEVIFVGTKKQAVEAVREIASSCGMPWVVERWLGGTLTNFATIQKSVGRLNELERMEEEGILDQLSKKEASALRREKNKLHRNLDGIKNMEKLPGAILVVDTEREKIAVLEALKIGIPIVALIDTNADPNNITYPIACNDDAIRNIRLILSRLAGAVTEGAAHRKQAEPEKAAVKKPVEKKEPAAAPAKEPKKAAGKAKEEEPVKEEPPAPEKKAEKAAATKKTSGKETAAKAEKAEGEEGKEEKAEAPEEKADAEKKPAKKKAVASKTSAGKAAEEAPAEAEEKTEE